MIKSVNESHAESCDRHLFFSMPCTLLEPFTSLLLPSSSCPLWALAREFSQGTLLSQHVKQFDKARRAYEKAATGSERQDSQWHAAKHLEQAAEVAKQAGDWDSCAQLSKQASQHYREVGKSQAAAEALAKAARLLEEHRPAVDALSLLSSAARDTFSLISLPVLPSPAAQPTILS